MAASEGNEFWRKRAKHGRDKIFSSPEILWEACIEYFQYTDTRKWYKTEIKGGGMAGPREFEVPNETPYTLTGLCVFLRIDENTWQRYRKEEPYKDFWAVVGEVDKIIYTQKFEGAAVGAFNSNIIARELGLVDKTEQEINGTTINITKTYNDPGDEKKHQTE